MKDDRRMIENYGGKNLSKGFPRWLIVEVWLLEPGQGGPSQLLTVPVATCYDLRLVLLLP